MPDISTTLPTLPSNDITSEQATSLDTQNTQDIADDMALDDDFSFEELGEELIIEDFTIDGICGVY